MSQVMTPPPLPQPGHLRMAGSVFIFTIQRSPSENSRIKWLKIDSFSRINKNQCNPRFQQRKKTIYFFFLISGRGLIISLES